MSNIPYWTPHPHQPQPGQSNCHICGERLPPDYTGWIGEILWWNNFADAWLTIGTGIPRRK